ncbi:hypothetical protein PR048_006626 [Dryococelus australis]|uniref:DUF4817 domain-containing protein n=1 Tax=Dryococelus australis TaxID=614101 RepID=A0ABQ9IBJ8_9NEOP|nr:hypothetical protein PR048_006626 [Dryococelus australis]
MPHAIQRSPPYTIWPPSHCHADINSMYGKANGNALEAARMYPGGFPHRRHTDRRIFIRIHRRPRENGSFAHHQRPGRPNSITYDVEELALECVDVNPDTSTRRVPMQEGINASSVWRILYRQLLYTYHIQGVQGLKNTDFLPILNLYQQIQHQRALHPQFLNNALLTYEGSCVDP